MLHPCYAVRLLNFIFESFPLLAHAWEKEEENKKPLVGSRPSSWAARFQATLLETKHHILCVSYPVSSPNVPLAFGHSARRRQRRRRLLLLSYSFAIVVPGYLNLIAATTNCGPFVVLGAPLVSSANTATMMQNVLLIIAAAFAYVIVSSVVGLRRQIAIAKTTNLPYVIVRTFLSSRDPAIVSCANWTRRHGAACHLLDRHWLVLGHTYARLIRYLPKAWWDDWLE